jgi:acyl-CoA synthetase (AMP-forming)/AMP-acid ligase II
VRVFTVDDDGRDLGPGEVGELCVGPARDGAWAGVYTTMLGYWNQPEASTEALRGGVLHTGDIGWVDDQGEVFVADRRHDLIIRGGANVYPAEVERVLHEDPRVAACAVIGKPDDVLGERVVAFVELTADAISSIGRPGDVAEELRAHCASNLAKYKVPEEVIVLGDHQSFERTPMGKIKKSTLRSPP